MSTSTDKPRRASNPEYFRSPNILWFLVIIPSMLYLSVLAYLPEVIPFDKLGPLGDFSQYLSKNHKVVVFVIFWCALAAHFFEAVFVVKRAKEVGICQSARNKWFFQTLLLGYPSTRLMNNYYHKNNK